MTPKLEKGFYLSCDDLMPTQRYVVYPGTGTFPMAQGVTAISLEALCERIRARRTSGNSEA
jgi:uncharacterized protein